MRVQPIIAGGAMAAAIIFGLEVAFDAPAPLPASGTASAPLVASLTTLNGGERAARVPRSADSHFWAETEINGARVRTLVDTGATLVALTRADARRAGLALDQLVYDHPIETAGGVVQAARVRLDRVVVGGIALERVDGIVAPEGLGYSLLGMSFLGRLTKLEVTRDALVLRE